MKRAVPLVILALLFLLSVPSYAGDEEKTPFFKGWAADVCLILSSYNGGTVATGSSDILGVLGKLEAEVYPKVRGFVRYQTQEGDFTNFLGKFDTNFEDFEGGVKVDFNVAEKDKEPSLWYAKGSWKVTRYAEKPQNFVANQQGYRANGYGLGVGRQADYSAKISPYGSISYFPKMTVTNVLMPLPNTQFFYKAWDIEGGVVFRVSDLFHVDVGVKDQIHDYRAGNESILNFFVGGGLHY